jgi:hypothetical protein
MAAHGHTLTAARDKRYQTRLAGTRAGVRLRGMLLTQAAAGRIAGQPPYSPMY